MPNSPRRPRLSIALFGLAISPGLALAAPSWVGGSGPAPGQSQRFGHAMVYDSGRGKVVLFGGYDAFVLDDTWEYDGIAWTGGPVGPPRAFHAMAYDAARGKTLLFGGSDGPGVFYNDTWEYDGSAWLGGVAPAAGMAPRQFAAMAFDATRARTVLYGGGDGFGEFDDTWEYDGVAWLPGAGSGGMSGRQAHMMAYDSTRSRIVVFGGTVGTFNLNDTWEYNGQAWTPGAATPPGLTPRSAGAMAYDVALGRMVLFGGAGSANYDDTWEYDGTAWTAGALAPASLFKRSLSAASYDSGRQRFVLFGGSDGTQSFSDTWEYVNGYVDFLLGQGLGQPNPNRVRIATGAGSATAVDFYAYSAGSWGCNVGAANIDADVNDEILTGPGPGDVLGPQARAFEGTGLSIGKVNFYAYGTLKYGVNIAGGNVDADGFEEILTGAGPGVVFGPHVRGWNYDASSLRSIGKLSFFAYGTLKYGVNVTTGRLDADAFAEIVTGPGPGAIFSPQVRGWNYDGSTVSSIAVINFNAYAVLQYGVNVAAGDVDADGFAEMATAPGPGAGVNFAARFVGFNYDGVSVGALTGFDVTPYGSSYGGRVGLGDVNPDGREDLLTGPGRDRFASPIAQARSYNGAGLVLLPNTVAPFTGGYGVNVAGGLFGY